MNTPPWTLYRPGGTHEPSLEYSSRNNNPQNIVSLSRLVYGAIEEFKSICNCTLFLLVARRALTRFKDMSWSPSDSKQNIKSPQPWATGGGGGISSEEEDPPPPPQRFGERERHIITHDHGSFIMPNNEKSLKTLFSCTVKLIKYVWWSLFNLFVIYNYHNG